MNSLYAPAAPRELVHAASALVTAGLCAFGLGLGSSDVAVNVDATDVERDIGVTTMPALHGCYSLGTVLGGGLGVAAVVAEMPVSWHLAAVTLLTGLLHKSVGPGARSRGSPS
jgi:fucose permease